MAPVDDFKAKRIGQFVSELDEGEFIKVSHLLVVIALLSERFFRESAA